MYQIVFYRDRDGKCPVLDWLKELKHQKGKDARVNLSKVSDYISILQEKGKAAGEPFLKHVEGEIWELRPLRNRIFFAAWNGDCFVLLHHFVKKTRKTPRREIEQANKELQEYQKKKERENGKLG